MLGIPNIFFLKRQVFQIYCFSTSPIYCFLVSQTPISFQMYNTFKKCKLHTSKSTLSYKISLKTGGFSFLFLINESGENCPLRAYTIKAWTQSSWTTSQQYAPFNTRTRRYSMLICRDKLSHLIKKKTERER